MSILTKNPIFTLLWNLVSSLMQSEGEPIVEAELAKHASLADLDEIEKIVAGARALKGASL